MPSTRATGSLYNNSNSIGVAWAADAVFGSGTTVELTKAWSINAGYQHIWGPAGTFGGKWRTTLYGGYVERRLQRQRHALINRGLPAGNVCGGALGTFTGCVPLAGNCCSPDFSFYQIGSRTQFNPHPLMDIGLDVFYTKLNSAYKGPVELRGERRATGLQQQRDHLLHVRRPGRAGRRSSAGSATSIPDHCLIVVSTSSPRRERSRWGFLFGQSAAARTCQSIDCYGRSQEPTKSAIRPMTSASSSNGACPWSGTSTIRSAG